MVIQGYTTTGYGTAIIPPPAVISPRAPATTDIVSSDGTPYQIGQNWQDTATGVVYFYVGGGMWELVAQPTLGPIDTVTGDSGGAVGPTLSNVNLLGTANQITTTGTAGSSQIVWSLPSAITAPGSLTTTTSLAAGTTLTSAGATTLATTGASVNTFGNTTGATSLALSVGTGNFTLNGVGASTYTVGAATTGGTIAIGGTAQTGSITVGGGTGAQTVNLATGATGVKTVHIADSAVANVVTLGSTTGAASTTVQSGTGGLTLTGGQVLPVTSVNNAATPYTLLGGDQFVAVDPTAGVVQITLPASPATGRFLTVYDATGQAASHTITVSGNGHNISAAGTSASTATLTTAYSSLNLWFNGTIWNARKVT